MKIHKSHYCCFDRFRCVRSSEVCDGGFVLGRPTYNTPRLSQPLAADIIVVVQESVALLDQYEWLKTAMAQLEQQLLDEGIGRNPQLPNHYMLVGFGRSVSVHADCCFADRSCGHTMLASLSCQTFTRHHISSIITGFWS